MTLLTPRDFETSAGQRRIILKIHTLEQKIIELNKLVHECLADERRLERDVDGLN